MDRVYKRKKKKTYHPFRTILILIVIAFCTYLGYEYKVNGNLNNVVQVISKINFNKINLSKINFEEKSYSSDNSIKGQIPVDNQDGYATTFTTLNKQYQKTYKEYKQNMDSSWCDNSYWGGTMRENGCGITSMAIVASGYGLNITPEDLRKEYYPHLEGEEMKTALKKMGFKCTDFCYHKSYLNKKYIMDWLKTNRPIIICLGSKDENDWTATSHYMALLDINDSGLVYVSNPNGLEGEKKASGWYSLSEILPYTVKALFIESY